MLYEGLADNQAYKNMNIRNALAVLVTGHKTFSVKIHGKVTVSRDYLYNIIITRIHTFGQVIWGIY